MNILPIGSVVMLNDGEQELMITARFPLYKIGKKSGYFDYAGCFYPQGQLDNKNYFFNSENIGEVHFTGYLSDDEAKLKQEIEKQIGKIAFPKWATEDLREG